MSATCPRCRSPLKPLGELAHQVERLTGRAISARDALASARLALPSVVPAALVTFELELPRLAAHLACHAGACTPSRPENKPAQALQQPLHPTPTRPSGELVPTEKARNLS